jgi:hypothetical protein
MSSTRAILVGLLLVSLGGCVDEADPTRNDPAGPGPAYRMSDAPESSGPVVFRTTDDLSVFFIPDDRAGLTAYIGVAEPMTVFCYIALPIKITPVELQLLFKPGGQLGWHVQGQDLPIYIYDLSTIDFCGGALTDDHILATGTVRLTMEDRNFELPDPNVEPSYGYNATGTVTYVGGGTAHVSGVVRWKLNGAPGVRALTHLRLTKDR